MASDTNIFVRVSQKMLDRHPGDEPGRMFNAPGLKTNGKFYAFATGDDLVVKLAAARVTDLIAAGVGRRCEPRLGRPMKQWVRLRLPDEQTCTNYLLEARVFVANLLTI